MPQALLCLALLAPSVSTLTQAGRARLQAQLEANTVPLRKPIRVQRGFRAPPNPYEYAAAWQISPHLLLTAQAFTAAPPSLIHGRAGTTPRFEARLEGGWWSFELLREEPRWGWALLKSKGVNVPAPKIPEFKLPSGSRLFAVDRGRLYFYEVTAPAEGQRAYFTWAQGAPLPLGAPLFDREGRFRTLVGLSAPDRRDAVLTLPSHAFLGLFAQPKPVFDAP